MTDCWKCLRAPPPRVDECILYNIYVRVCVSKREQGCARRAGFFLLVGHTTGSIRRVFGNEVKPGAVVWRAWARPGQAKSRRGEASQARPSRGELGQVEATQAKLSQAKPSQAKSSQANPSQPRPTRLIPARLSPTHPSVHESQRSPPQSDCRLSLFAHCP